MCSNCGVVESVREIKSRAGNLGPGLDVRGEGGLIVVAPSIHPITGNAYRWTGDQQPQLPLLARAPLWLEQLVGNDNQTPHEGPDPTLPPNKSCHPNYGRKALRDECERIVSAVNGTQEDTLNKACHSIGTLVGAGVTDRAEAEAELIRAALSMHSYNPQQPWLPSELRRKIVHALDDGMRKPRALPSPEEPIHRYQDEPGSNAEGNIPAEFRELNRSHATVWAGVSYVQSSDTRIFLPCPSALPQPMCTAYASRACA